MEAITVKELLAAVHGELLQGDETAKILGVNTDSRTVKAGEVFVPLVGERLMLTLAEIRPVALAVPAHGDAVEIAVRLLPQVDIVDGASRLLPQLRDDILELRRRERRTARDMERIHPLTRRHIRGVEMEFLRRRAQRVSRRAEIARQRLLAVVVETPDEALELLRLLRLRVTPHGCRHRRRRLRCLGRVSLRQHPEGCPNQETAENGMLLPAFHNNLPPKGRAARGLTHLLHPRACAESQ